MDDASPQRPDLSLVTIEELIRELKSRSLMGAIVLQPRHQEAGAQNQVVCFFADGNSTALIGLLSAVHYQVCAAFVERNFSEAEGGDGGAAS